MKRWRRKQPTKEGHKALFSCAFIRIVETINCEDAITTQRLHAVLRFFCVTPLNGILKFVFTKRKYVNGRQKGPVPRDTVARPGNVLIATYGFLMLVSAY